MCGRRVAGARGICMRWLAGMLATLMTLATATAVAPPGTLSQGPRDRAILTQESALFPVFSAMDLASAHEYAKQTGRLLLVVSLPDVHTGAGHRIWGNRTLAAWVKWHAVAINVAGTSDERLLRTQGVRAGEVPLAFVMGRYVTLFGTPFDAASRSGIMGNASNAAWLLNQCDLTLEAAKARDPVFRMLHDLHCPEPPAPERPEARHLWSDEYGEAVHDPWLPGDDMTQATADNVDLLSHLESARRAVDAGAVRDAVGYYSYLVERAEALDPAFAPISRGLMIKELRTFAVEHPAAKKRLEMIIDDWAPRLPWADYAECHRWYTLCDAADHESAIIHELALHLNDGNEMIMTPLGVRAAYQLLAEHLPISGDWWKMPNTLRDLRTLARRANAGRSPSIVRPDWETLQPLRKRMLWLLAVQAHAEYLRAGRDADADEAATLALQSVDPALVKRSLIMAALSVGEVHRAHHAWMRELVAAGKPAPALEQRLRAASAP